MKTTSFSERLNEALVVRDISAAELSRLSMASEGIISDYRKGKYEPKQRRVDLFAKILDVSIAWLMGYDVPMGRYDGTLSIVRPHLMNVSGILPMPKMKKVPLLGNIACGEPVLAIENIDEFVDADEDMDCDFALACKGDSMINARIFDGDIVYVRNQPMVENGEIAAVCIDGEATLKRVYQQPDYLELRAENPMYKPLVYRGIELEQVRVLGKAIWFKSMVR